MNTKKMGVRDLVREGKNITQYDFIDIEDKKTGQYRGVFVSYQYADDVKAFLTKKQKQKVSKIMKFSGMADGLFDDETVQSIKSKKNI
jgi:hypothetical protein